MTSGELFRLNEILAALGRIPYGEWVGQPVYQFKRGRELMNIHKTSETGLSASGLSFIEAKYKWSHQTSPDDNRWSIAKWIPPDFLGMTEAAWKDKYPGLAWPKHGYWLMFQPLKEGYTPTEEWAQWAVNHIDWQTNMDDHDRWNRMIEHYEKPDREMERICEELTHGETLYHVPGTRGGSYSVPATKFDR